jgi:hypothetical protein
MGFSFSAICPYAQFIQVRSPLSEGIICIKRKGALLLAMGLCLTPVAFQATYLVSRFWAALGKYHTVVDVYF